MNSRRSIARSAPSSRRQCPKDADLLVTVRDDANLVPLAAAGRKLKGHAQQQNCGADVFLCSADEVYLGRICH